MFRVFGCCRKNIVHVETEESRTTYSSLSSVSISLTSSDTTNSDENISKWNRLFGRPVKYQKDIKSVSISLTSSDTTNSDENISIWNRLFGRPVKYQKDTKSVSISLTSAPTTNSDKNISIWNRVFGRPVKDKKRVTTSKPKKKSKKRRWWIKKRNRVAPSPVEPLPKRLFPCIPCKDTVVKVTGGKGPGIQEVLSPVAEKEEEPTISVPEPLRKCLGLPNPAQICYMNSCLQSLLTLEDFIESISCQEPVWSLTPNTAVMSSLTDISRSHVSCDARHKIRLLIEFKNAVAALNPEFEDLDQKDAHEFLTSVLHQIRSLEAQLRMKAESMGRTYSCPVEDHMLFKMRNVRTCQRCGEGSTKEEEYTCLSLDLIPGKGTIGQMLGNYLKETELEYKCECGATVSHNRMSFVNLPRVLVLHLKRFRFTPMFQLKKVHDPVDLPRDLMVSSSGGGACYNLVSTISHLGHSAKSGHYVSDGMALDVGREDVSDSWFTYDDAVVTKTTGHSVCAKRSNSSYILFYKRQEALSRA